MPTITLTFNSISEMESFRSQGQTVQPKTNSGKLFVVEVNYIEDTYVAGIFYTLSEAYRYYREVCKTHYNDPNYDILVMEWDLDNQCGTYLEKDTFFERPDLEIG